MTRKFLTAILAIAILAGCMKDEAPVIPATNSSYLVLTVLRAPSGTVDLVKYYTDGSGGAAIVSSRIDAGNELAFPAISPKGNKAVYFDGGIMKVMNVKTDVRTVIYNQASFYLGSPSFSSDETRITFSAFTNSADRTEIFVVNATENATPVKVFNNDPGYFAMYPRFSADGSKITFVNGELDDGGVHTSDVQGGNVIRVSEDHQAGDVDACPVFSPDGNKVIYSSSKYGQSDDILELMTSEATAGSEGNATRVFEAAASGIVESRYPAISPDGGTIYFIGTVASGEVGIYKVASTGGSPVKIKTLYTDLDIQIVNLTYVQE
jgi:Tol biopolymer transport system component